MGRPLCADNSAYLHHVQRVTQQHAGARERGCSREHPVSRLEAEGRPLVLLRRGREHGGGVLLIRSLVRSECEALCGTATAIGGIDRSASGGDGGAESMKAHEISSAVF